MSRETETIAYACENQRCRLTVQLAAIELSKPADVWVEDRDVSQFKTGSYRQGYDLLRKRLRKGDTLLVYKLFVMAPGKRDRHARLVKRMADLSDAGIHVRQLSPPLSTTKRGERDAMLAQAMADLSRVGLHKSTGRPKRVISEREREIITRHWKHAEHRRDADAFAAMVKDGLPKKGVGAWSLSIVLKNFGRSGRPYGKK